MYEAMKSFAIDLNRCGHCQNLKNVEVPLSDFAKHTTSKLFGYFLDYPIKCKHACCEYR